MYEVQQAGSLCMSALEGAEEATQAPVQLLLLQLKSTQHFISADSE